MSSGSTRWISLSPGTTWISSGSGTCNGVWGGPGWLQDAEGSHCGPTDPPGAHQRLEGIAGAGEEVAVDAQRGEDALLTGLQHGFLCRQSAVGGQGGSALTPHPVLPLPPQPRPHNHLRTRPQ